MIRDGMICNGIICNKMARKTLLALNYLNLSGLREKMVNSVFNNSKIALHWPLIKPALADIKSTDKLSKEPPKFPKVSAVHSPHKLINSQRQVFQYWLLFAGLVAFMFLVLIDLGVLTAIVQTDVTRICLVVLVLFVCFSFYCGYRSWFIAVQFDHLEHLKNTLKNKNYTSLEALTLLPAFQSSHTLTYLNAIKNASAEQDISQLGEVLAESIRGSHKVGLLYHSVMQKELNRRNGFAGPSLCVFPAIVTQAIQSD